MAIDIVEQRLHELKNADEVGRFLEELTEPWGGVKRLDVVKQENGELLCFVELKIAENKTRFYSVIPGTSYGESFVFRIPGKTA